MELSGTHWLMVSASDDNILGENINTTERNSKVVLDASKVATIELNVDK
jgi:hypothetical protein